MYHNVRDTTYNLHIYPNPTDYILLFCSMTRLSYFAPLQPLTPTRSCHTSPGPHLTPARSSCHRYLSIPLPRALQPFNSHPTTTPTLCPTTDLHSTPLSRHILLWWPLPILNECSSGNGVYRLRSKVDSSEEVAFNHSGLYPSARRQR